MTSAHERWIEEVRESFGLQGSETDLDPQTYEHWQMYLKVWAFSRLEQAVALHDHALDPTGNMKGVHNETCDTLIEDINKLRYPEAHVGEIEDIYDWLDAVEQRHADLRSMPYDEFLMSPEWAEARRSALRRAGNACQGCSATERLQVHHRTYERRGQENADDLIVLCSPCHRALHLHGGAHRPRTAHRSAR